MANGWQNRRTRGVMPVTGHDYRSAKYRKYLDGRSELVNPFEKLECGMKKKWDHYLMPDSRAAHVPAVYVARCLNCDWGPYVGYTLRSIHVRCRERHLHAKEYPTHKIEVWPVQFLKDGETQKGAETSEALHMTSSRSIRSELNPRGSNIVLTAHQLLTHRAMCGFTMNHYVANVPLDETYADNEDKHRGKLGHYLKRKREDDAEH